MSPKEFISEAKTIGIRRAWNHLWHRRHIPIVGYLLLTLAVAYSLAENKAYYVKSQKAQKKETQAVVFEVCSLQNTLIKILSEGITTIKNEEKKHLIRKTLAENTVNQEKNNINYLKTSPCNKPPPGS